MQTIDRMMLLLEAVERSDQNGMTITELSLETKLPYATLHRLLTSLMSYQLLEQNMQKKYFLGQRWLQYGLYLYDRMDFISLIRSDLDKLAYSIGESVYLYKLEDEESMIIERIDCGLQHIQIVKPLGLRTPLYEGVANLAMLAFLKKEQLTSCTVDELLLEQIRLERFYMQKNEKDGVLDMAIPLLSAQRHVVGAVSLTVLLHSLKKQRIEFLKHELQRTVQQMELKLRLR